MTRYIWSVEHLFSVRLELLVWHVEEVDVVEELVVGQRVEHAAHVEDQSCKDGWVYVGLTLI